MFAPSPRLQNVKLPVIAAVIAAIVLAALGVRFFLQSRAPTETRAQAPRVQPAVVRTAPVSTGSISSVFSYAGSIQSKDQVSLVPKTSGIVQSIPVDVGTRVRAGDVVATLDPGTLPDQLLQAQAGLEQAQAKLQQVLAQGRPDDIAAAQAQLMQGQAKLDSLLQQGRFEDIEAAQQALGAAQARLDQMIQGGRAESVASAQAGLDSANAKLATVLRGPTDDVRQSAQNAVNADLAAVSSAQAALLNANNTTSTDIQTAQASVNSSQAAVLTARDAIINLPQTFPSDLRAAQSSYDAAALALSNAQNAYETGKNQQTTAVSPTSLATAQATVAQAQANYDAAQANMTNLQLGVSGGSSSAGSLCARDPISHGVLNATACNAATTAATSALSSAQQSLTNAQNQLNTLKQGPSPAQFAAQLTPLRQSYEQAQANAATARSKLDQLATGGFQMRQSELQSTLDAAEGRLAADQARLDALRASGTAAAMSVAESTLIAAQERLKSDQARLEEVMSQPKREDVEAADAAVEQARQTLALAIRPSSPEDIRAQQAVVDQARAQLQKAQQPFTTEDIRQQQQVVAQLQAQLQAKIRPFTGDDIRVAQTAVDQARAQVAVAKANLDQMVLTAPFDGVVGQKMLTAGAFASTQAPILTLSGHGTEVHITVEEARIAAVAPGQSVQLALAAYPGVTFMGRVATVAPVGDARAHTFDVAIYPDNPDARMMAGMYAQVQVTAAEKQFAILVPREAVVQQPDGSTVFVVQNGKAEARKVTVGLTDDMNQEIITGVAAGEEVVVQGQNTLKDGQAVVIPGAAPDPSRAQQNAPRPNP